MNTEELNQLERIVRNMTEARELRHEAKKILDEFEPQYLDKVSLISIENDLCRRIVTLPDYTKERPSTVQPLEFQSFQAAYNISNTKHLHKAINTSDWHWYIYRRNSFIILFYAKNEKEIAMLLQDVLEKDSQRKLKNLEEAAKSAKKFPKSRIYVNLINEYNQQKV